MRIRTAAVAAATAAALAATTFGVVRGAEAADDPGPAIAYQVTATPLTLKRVGPFVRHGVITLTVTALPNAPAEALPLRVIMRDYSGKLTPWFAEGSGCYRYEGGWFHICPFPAPVAGASTEFSFRYTAPVEPSVTSGESEHPLSIEVFPLERSQEFRADQPQGRYATVEYTG